MNNGQEKIEDDRHFSFVGISLSADLKPSESDSVKWIAFDQ